jgi:hypothetical protein
VLCAQPELGCIEQPVDDIESAAQTIVHKLRVTLPVDEEQRRRFADAERCRKFDERLTAIVEGAQRSPRCRSPVIA